MARCSVDGLALLIILYLGHVFLQKLLVGSFEGELDLFYFSRRNGLISTRHVY